MRRALWHKIPHVRSGDDLTLGERAADHLKTSFGSWPFLIILNAIIVGWIILQALLGKGAFDPYPWLLLNIGLSWLAAQQGGALQIAANRGDRISSELALSTHDNGEKLLALTEAVKRDTALLEEIHAHVTALSPQAGTFAPGAERMAGHDDQGRTKGEANPPAAR
jgi:uncharacterized membrane protein